jgi:transcriptional regulator with XRE-family HTH domain
LSVPDDLLVTVIEGTYLKERRNELASFLRSRRARVRPQDVGLAPGLRRRTPGLRREEVAQLAGVGVTWYTWLEQGRPINASVQVLDAIARVFKLGPAERWHLYRLADVPGVPTGGSDTEAGQLPAEVPGVLDALGATAACVYNGKYDLLACNETYAALFPNLATATGCERNALWQIFTMRKCPLLNVDVLPHMVAVLRANYARHVGEPQWTDFVAALSAASKKFAELWATHQVAAPMPAIKWFQADDGTTIDMRTTGLHVDGMPEARLVVYMPATSADAAKIERLRVRARLRRVPDVSAAG